MNIIKDFSVLKVKTGELWSYSGFRFRQLLKEIAKRANLTIEEIEYLLSKEVIDFLETGKKLPSHEKIKRRMKFSVLIIKNRAIELHENSKAHIVVKEELKEENDGEIKELRGQVAYLEEVRGEVRGKVKIVFGKEKIAKFKLGEILVTGMTSVDYVPAIKKAKAIITDEGGITCHASVIARELKIPTIIGTKIATRVLHDGDLVEVDANRGIVKILKK